MVERAAEIGFLLVLVAGIPVMSWITAHDPQVRTAPRPALYASAALSEWMFTGMGLAAVRVARLSAASLGFRSIPWPSFAYWTGLVLLISGAGLALVLLLERRGWWPDESDLVYLLMPKSRAEKAWALALVAPTAALAEEFLYRGYLFAMIARGLHSTVWAWGLSSAAFGLAHLYQRPSGMVRAALLGALLAWPLARTGSLYPGMATHFLIDAVAFGWLGPKMLRGE
ncbi:MAG TPA: CPBP family intramembrane glutamic endopeptidase [Terriglobia bacterium]|nr:CPBP family intramembrane glutamic endopeptidase [Terriglobia bacterium]